MKKSLKLFLISCITMLAFAGTLTACNGNGGDSSVSGGENSNNSSTVTPEQVEISIVGSMTMTEFETITLTAIVTGSTESVVWTSSDSSVATVENGIVTALKAGTVEIKASIGDVFATHTLTISQTTISHELSFSVGVLSMFEGESSSVNVGVKYNDETLDDSVYGIEYTWSVVSGDAEVATVTPSENGSTLTVVGNKVGSVTYQVETIVRGYTVRDELTITILGVSKELGFENDKFVPGETGYSLDLTLGDTETAQMEIGNVVYVLNGAPTTENATVAWSSSDGETVAVEDGVIKGLKAGTATLTGTATYKEETLTVSVVVNVAKNQVQLTDRLTLETVVGGVEIPTSIEASSVEKVVFNKDNIVFDKANEKGSIEGDVLTFDQSGTPAKMSDLGLGKTMTVETDTTIYTIPVDIYTMIISDKDELDSWQETAAENAVKAGLCLEIQKGFVLSGYFALDSNIEYDGVWSPYKSYSELWAMSKDNTNNADLKDVNGEFLEGVVVEAWNYGIDGGFQGVFDGQGYNIGGIETTGDFSGFIVINGKNGVIKNLSFTDAKVGAGSSLLVVNGQGTVKNIYMEIDSFGENAVTFFRSSSAPIRTVESVLIDVTDCKLTTLNQGWLASQCGLNAYKGVYVIGAGETLADKLFDEAKNCTAIGGFDTPTALIAEETQGVVVKTWDSQFWEITDNYALPKSIVDFYKGPIAFTNTETVINLNGEVAFGTDKEAKYIVYSLKDANESVALNGNMLSVKEGATVGDSVTVVATSLIDGQTAEYTLTIADALIKETIATKFYAEADNSNTAVLQYDGFAVGNTYVVTINGTSTTATVETEGQLTVVIDNMNVSTAENMSVYTVACKNDTQELIFNNVVAITKILKLAEDLRVLNGAAVGAGNYVLGYYLLGDNIDCADALYEANSYSTGFFRGVFDGNNYTISNIKVGSCGIFGALYAATIKDVNFTNVSIVATSNNFNTLFAGSITNNSTIENVNVSFKVIEWPYTNSYADNKVTGLLGARWNNTAHAVRNVTLDATGLTITNALGVEISGVTFENVNVLADDVTLIACTTAYDNTTNLTEWPTGVTYTDTYDAIEISDEFYVEAGNIVLKNSAFEVGESYDVTVGGTTVQTVITEAGKLTATMEGMSTGKISVKCVSGSKGLTFNNVMVVTKILRTAEDLRVLNAYTASGNITGYYILDGDIDCGGVTYSATGRDGTKAFKGTFDGRGYTIRNLKAGANGIFNLIVDGTVKNVKFEGVSIIKDNYHFTGLLAGQSWGNTTIENISVKFDTIEWPINNVLTDWAATGLLIARLSNASGTIFRNVTIDATGLAITNALGTEITGVQYQNVTIKGDSVALIGCTGANSSTGVAEWPTGVTYTCTNTGVAVTAPTESNYYTFSGAKKVESGDSYTFTVTEKVSGLNDFIVLVNGEEITGNNGTYTLANVTEALTIKVLHGYIEHGEKVTVTYNADGSIKVENAVFANGNAANAPWLAYISAEYIEYMISKGYKNVGFTIQADGAIMAQAVASYNGNIFVYHVDGTAKYFEQALGTTVSNDLQFWGQSSGGSGNAIKDQGGYITITGLTFVA